MENNIERFKFMYEQYTWRITNFSKLDSKKLYSEKFLLDHHTWRILIFPKGNNVDYLSIYLDAGGDLANLPKGWGKFACFRLALTNQVNDKMTIMEGYEHCFSAKDIDRGFEKFIPLNELYDSSSGFIVNDTCIIEAGIFVDEYANEVDQPVSRIDDKPIKHMTNPLSHEMFTNSFGELVDFRGFGKIEKDFVSLLEEVCSQYPSLVDSQQKRSRRFNEWAFTALGRVLHFLKTKKVKDMDDEACNHLQILWEELETCKFDLTWLEPHVQSALAVKNYMEKADKVRKIKEKVAALETELEIARRELVKAEEGFEERNLDAELGYGRA